MIDLPADRFTLTRARVPTCLARIDGGVTEDDGLALVDIDVAAGRIDRIAAHDPDRTGTLPVDLARRMVWPCPVDLHTHLDKGHIWPRAANPDGTFDGALATVRADRDAHWSADDVRARFEFGLRCAFAHGTVAIRTHLDSQPPQDRISWPVFAELCHAWKGRIELQAVSLAMQEHYRGEDGRRLADRVAAHGGILGLVPLMGPELDADLDHLFRLASDRGLDLDCHIDETADAESRTLRHLAEAAIRNGYEGTILAGHCCSLARQEPDDVSRTLDLVARAGIAVVSLPMCNMYLQDRHASRTPRWRGVTLAHEIRSRGIPMAFASDNCRDPFCAYGDHDLHEVFRQAVRTAHLDHPIGGWPAAVTTVPAGIMGIEAGLIAPGRAADLIIFDGRSWSEVLSRGEERRVLVRAGKAIGTTLPSYAELDRDQPMPSSLRP